jgi:hypothetical protein
VKISFAHSQTWCLGGQKGFLRAGRAQLGLARPLTWEGCVLSIEPETSLLFTIKR